MLKKFISIILICTFLVPFCNISGVNAADPNEVYYSFNFSDRETNFSGWPSYSNVPDGYSTSGHPSFKSKSDGEVMNFSTFGFKVGTSTPIPYAAGRTYPQASTYENLQLVVPNKTPSVEANYANENIIGYSYKLKFASENNGYRAGFPKYLKHLIRTGTSYTDDFTVWEIDKDGIFKFGSYTKQLSLDTEYSLFILTDQRGTNSTMSLYIDGGLVVSNRAMSTTSKDIHKFLYQLNSSETNSSGECVWKDVDLYISNVNIYKMTDPYYVEINGGSTIYTDTFANTYSYSAESLIGHKGLNWSVIPSDGGVTVSSAGLVTVNPTARDGSYTLGVSNSDGSVSATKELTLQCLTYEIEGDNTIYVSKNKGYQKIPYSVKNSNGATVSVPITLSGGNTDVLKFEDGTVKINGAFQGTSFTLNANVGGTNITKTVQVKKTEFYDFQSDESKVNWSAGTGGISNPWAESDGNVYLDPQATRWDLIGIIGNVIEAGIITAEFNFIPEANATGYSMIFAGADNGTDDNSWWGELKISSADNFFKYNGIPTGTFLPGWNKMKITFDFGLETIKISINGGASVSIPQNKFASSSSLYDFKFKRIITYMAIDDFKIYSGDAINYEITNINVPSQLVIPAQGQEKSVTLTADVTEDSIPLLNPDIEWSLKNPCSFGFISEGKFKYNENAQGTAVIVAALKNTNVTLEKTVTFAPSDVTFNLSADEKLNIKGTPNASVRVIIYAPKDTSDNISKFMGAYTNADGQSPLRDTSLSLDSSGEGVYDVSSLQPGRYRVYTIQGGSVLNYDAEIDIKKKSLFDDISNFESEKLDEFLYLHTDCVLSDASYTEQCYRSITDKQNAVKLMEKDFNKFAAGCYSIKFIESSSYNEDSANKLKGELAKHSVINFDFDAVKKNTDYSKVMEGTINYQSLGAMCTSINTNSILAGIKNVVNTRDADYFLLKLSHSPYSTADEYTRGTICDLVAKKSYASLQAVKDKIDSALSGLSGGGEDLGGSNPFVSDTSGSGGGPSQNVSYPSNPAATGFNDVPSSHWASKYINVLGASKVINGYDGNNYMPENSIKRSEFVKILCEAFNISGFTEEGFGDADKSEWYYPYIIRAKANGLIEGSGGNFYPDNNISRQDAAVMVYRFAKFTGKSFNSGNKSFADDGAISDYAKNAVYSLADAGIIAGMGNNTFAPLNNITRAEAAKIIYCTLYGGEN